MVSVTPTKPAHAVVLPLLVLAKGARRPAQLGGGHPQRPRPERCRRRVGAPAGQGCERERARRVLRAPRTLNERYNRIVIRMTQRLGGQEKSKG